MNPVLHVLPLVVESVDLHRYDELRRLTVSSVDEAHRSGGQLDLVMLFGAGPPGPNGDPVGAELVDAVYEGCVDAGAPDFPCVVPVPGPGDPCVVPPGRMLFDTLVHRWSEVEQRVWAGEQDDVVEALERTVFPTFTAWQRRVAAQLPSWCPGVLPGEGTFELLTGANRIGFAIVNSVFRGIDQKFGVDRVVLSGAQLERAAGGSWAEWSAQNALTIVASGLAAPLPTLLDARTPTLLMAGRHASGELSQSRRTWFLADARKPACLKIEFVPERPPRVEEVSKRSQKRTIALLEANRGTSSLAVSNSDEAAPAETVLSDFYHKLESGQMIAVIVSGLPGDGAIASLDTLCRQLASDVFGQVPQPEPTLGEIWPAAQARLAEARLKERLDGLASVDGANLPDLHRVLTGPWWRVYDFSATGAVKMLVDSTPLNSMSLTNALVEKPGDRKGLIDVVAMNGSFDSTVGSVDFSIPSADSPSARALWFNRLRAEIIYHPVVIFAESTRSPALWHVLGSLSLPPAQEGFSRFIVAPEAGNSERVRIQHAGLAHIAMTPSDFAQSRLLPGDQRLAQGKRRLSESLTLRDEATGISLVSTLISKMTKGSKEFLKGREPDWGDVTGNFAAPLSVVGRVMAELRKFDAGTRVIVLLRGAAGSGKTTTLMQCAYRLHQAGKVVGWIDRSATKSLESIRSEALERELDVIFVDDVDIFGSRASALLREFTRGGKTMVVAAVRNTRIEFVPSALPAVEVFTDDPLSDDDLKALIKVLKMHGLLGVLKQYRWSTARRLEELRRMCEQSLLVAMIQVVTGERFEDKVRSEFEELGDAQALVYATVCVLESAEVFKRRGIDPVDLLQIVSSGASSQRMLEAISSLVHARLIVRGANGVIRCRQRTIADTVIKVVLKKRVALLGEVVKSLMRFYAGYAGDIEDSNNPYRRTMVRLLNHAMMIELRLPDDVVREIYDSVHEFLEYDFHYWLQRGEFELQRNHLGVAANYFQAARGCGGEGDYKVETGWASVTLRRSAEDSSDSGKLEAAIQVLKTLDGVCRTRGVSSEHSFVVMARAGTEWLERVHKYLLDQDFAVAVSTIKGVIDLGRRINLESFQFDRAAREYEPRLARLVDRHQGVPT